MKICCDCIHYDFDGRFHRCTRRATYDISLVTGARILKSELLMCAEERTNCLSVCGIDGKFFEDRCKREEKVND
jgi:hypothetical protein